MGSAAEGGDTSQEKRPEKCTESTSTEGRQNAAAQSEEKQRTPKTGKKTAGPKQAAKAAAGAGAPKKPNGAGTAVHQLGVGCGKAENFAQWYTEVITKGELIEYYDVSGCYILRPWAYYLWECVQDRLNEGFKKNKIRNCYFPMFVTKAKLETEKAHVEGFSAEVAWVTQSGSSKLAEPIAIRPTSETIMYPAFQKWIRSHRDLPLKLNQWCPVVRWEFSHPTPFIRTREFLWQEGHTAHASSAEADEFARKMLDLYADLYKWLFAVPVCRGQKSELEKFAGGDKTYTVEAFVDATGRSIQAGTSHNLASNFAEMFDIEFEDEKHEKALVSQTSFGLSTRALGAVVMIHGDDKGLVLPPRCAPVQIVVVPIVKIGCDEAGLISACKSLTAALEEEADLRVECDDRQCYNPGWKYNHWEQKGVPLRIEVGPRDLEQNTCRLVARVDGSKQDVKRDPAHLSELVTVVTAELDRIHTLMYANAAAQREKHTVRVTTFAEVMPALNNKCIILAPWCRKSSCEEEVKKQTAKLSQEAAELELSGSMKTLCIPFDQPELSPGTKCFNCDSEARVTCLWGRSY